MFFQVFGARALELPNGLADDMKVQRYTAADGVDFVFEVWSLDRLIAQRTWSASRWTAPHAAGNRIGQLSYADALASDRPQLGLESGQWHDEANLLPLRACFFFYTLSTARYQFPNNGS